MSNLFQEKKEREEWLQRRDEDEGAGGNEVILLSELSNSLSPFDADPAAAGRGGLRTLENVCQHRIFLHHHSEKKETSDC